MGAAFRYVKGRQEEGVEEVKDLGGQFTSGFEGIMESHEAKWAEQWDALESPAPPPPLAFLASTTRSSLPAWGQVE